MGRKPSNGGPSFRFNNTEVAEMESMLQAHDIQVPGREVLSALAEKFSNMPERSGKVEVQIKQVWNWFQNRRYALRAKAGNMRSVLHSTRPNATLSGQGEANNVPETPPMEFEARSARDGAWYDVACFLSHRSLETGDPEVLVRFSGFGPEEDEWVNVRKHIRQRSLPCEASECVAVLPGDLILCFQEGKEQALYFDAHVLDSQRRRHDARGCRCRFLVRYDHDQSEEIVPLRKICRRPETDYRLQQLHAEAANKMHQQRAGADIHSSNPGKGPVPAEPTKEQIKVDAGAGTTVNQAIGDLKLSTHSPSGNTPKQLNFNCETPEPQHTMQTPVGTVVTQIQPAPECPSAATTFTQTCGPVFSYPKVSAENTQPRHSEKTDADMVETQSVSAAVGQVAVTPTQAEPLVLTGSQPSAETHAKALLTQIIPGTEGHAVAVGSATPAQISLPEPGESKELLETTQPQYPEQQIMPSTEGHEVAVCAATPLNSLPELSKSKESFETTKLQPQYSAETHAEATVETLMVPTNEPGAAVATAISTQTSLPIPSESEVPLETTQPQLSADTKMLPATEGLGADLVTATPTQASLPKPDESESSLDTSPLQHSTEAHADTLETQVLPATELHETVAGARTLAQISPPEPNESNVLLETFQQPHSEETPADSLLTQILSSTAAATPTQTSLPDLPTNMPPGEN